MSIINKTHLLLNKNEYTTSLRMWHLLVSLLRRVFASLVQTSSPDLTSGVLRLNNKNLVLFILLTIISVVIIMTAWFSSGSLIANSEESLSTYSPSKSISLNISLWSPEGIGTRNPFGINRAYPFMVLLQFGKIGIPAFINQGVLIGFTMICTLFFSYLLFNYLSKGSFFISSFGAFFYLLNLYTQTQIFRRFLYNFMFALAYFPLFLYLWIKCLETKNWKYLLLFLLSSVLFSFSFNHPATIFTFTLSAFIVFLTIIKKEPTLKARLSLLRFSLVTLLLGVLINFWWIAPLTLSSGDYLGSISNTPQSDLKLLEGVSNYFPIQQIILLRQSWWYGPSQHWYGFYNSPPIYFLSISIFFIVIYGLIKLKSQYKPLLLTLLVVGLFISKGTNFPLGYVFFDILFSKFPFTSALRNSYEKFGIVFLLPYTYFFSYGLFLVVNKFSGFKKTIAIISFALLYLIILVWPIWTGDIFLKEERVKVPEYYSVANNFLNQKSDLRIFHLPLTNTFGEEYRWGFKGQDPSEYLFDRPSLSNTFSSPLNTVFYPKLPELAQNKDFPRLLGFLGVSNIVVHAEAQNRPQDILITEEPLAFWNNLQKAAQFGSLTIYDLDSQIIRSRFYTLSKLPQKSFPDQSILEDNFVNLNYRKIGLNHYQVEIENSRQPFFLIFNEKFDSLWQASTDSKIPLKHFKVYNLVNSWYVERLGSFKVDVKFKL